MIRLDFAPLLTTALTPGVFAVTVAYVQEEWADGGAGRAMAVERAARLGAVLKGLGYRGIHIAGVHRGSLAALSFARSLSADVTAVHVSVNPTDAEKVREKWGLYGEGTRLVILPSPYRLLVEPIMEYLERELSAESHARTQEELDSAKQRPEETHDRPCAGK